MKTAIAAVLMVMVVGCASSNTHRIAEGESVQIWVESDGATCGTVTHFANIDGNAWKAYAYQDYSRTHTFTSESEAVNWITKNWCRP